MRKQSDSDAAHVAVSASDQAAVTQRVVREITVSDTKRWIASPHDGAEAVESRT